MTKEKKIRKLTDIQREILEALRDGAVITVDRHNMAWLGDRPVQPQTRYFLTDNRLITRLDKKRSVESKGNGFVISEKGLAVLDEQPPRKKSSFHRKSKQERPVEPEPPTERQLNYAKDLGINIPQDATKFQVSDMISARLNRDKSATCDRHRSFADLYGVQYTKYTGKRDLFERIYSALSRPDHEEELVSWFVFRVYRNLVKGAEDVSIASPNHAIISDIAKQLISNDSVMRSIQRYDGEELIWFGEWTAPDGTYHTGGSKRTVAYKKAASLLSDKLELESRSRTRNYANRSQSTSDELSRSVNKGTTGRGGCLSVVIFVGVITIAVIGTVVWVINLS